MPGTTPTSLCVEESNPRKIMNDLIRERSWPLWSEKDHKYFDPRKITEIDPNKRSLHDLGSPKPKPKPKLKLKQKKKKKIKNDVIIEENIKIRHETIIK